MLTAIMLFVIILIVINISVDMACVIILIAIILSVDMVCVNMLSHYEKCRNDVYRYA